MRQSGRLKGDVQGEETPIRPCAHLHLYSFSIKITQHIFIFIWTLIWMCHQCISWIWKHSHSNGSLDSVFTGGLVTLMKENRFGNLSVHLNHTFPLKLQKPGLEINGRLGQKGHENEQKCLCTIKLDLLWLSRLKCNVKLMKRADYGTFTVDLLTLHQISVYAQFAVLSIVTNHTRLCWAYEHKSEVFWFITAEKAWVVQCTRSLNSQICICKFSYHQKQQRCQKEIHFVVYTASAIITGSFANMHNSH